MGSPTTLRLTDTVRGIQVESLDSGGQLLGRDMSRNLASAPRRRQAANDLGVDQSVLLSALNQFGLASVPTADYPVITVEPPVFHVRDITGRGQPRAFSRLDDALAAPVDLPEPVIEWDGLDACAAVDLDFHGDTRPEPTALNLQASKIEPRPAMSWVTRGGGLRLVYFESLPMTAHDLAAVAAMQLLRWNPGATVEILSRTRRPPGDVTRREQTSATGYLSRFYEGKEVALELIDDWLGKRDMEVGGRYPHTLCPHNPNPRAAANSEPVCVMPDGIHCYICAADGVDVGHGFGQFPWSKLCDAERVGSQLRACVENCTHWDQARLVLLQVSKDETPLPEPLARAAYAAMLRCRHGRDPRIPMVFEVAKETGLIRMQGFWATRSGESVKVRYNSRILTSLPAAYIVQDDKLVSSPERIEWLSQTVPLMNLGYPAVVPIWGCRLTQFQNVPPDRLPVVMQTAGYRADVWANRRSRYVSACRRMPEHEARGTIERAYPQVNWKAVELLIVAKGCSEHRAGLPPMIYISGPTGAGKTATCALAAGICGDHVSKVVFTPNTDRLFAGIRTARGCGSFVNFDEFVKHASASRRTPETAMEILLAFDPNAMTHQLYNGPVMLGDLPALIWADTQIHEGVSGHMQIGRRLHHVGLESEMQWEQPLADYKINGPENLRFADDTVFVAASDAILSAVIDRHFRGVPATDFAAVAKELGFKQLRESGAALERRDAVCRLFKAVCEKTDGVEEPRENDRTRWSQAGCWRVVNLGGDSVAADQWRQLHDDGNLQSSQKIAELDLQQVLGLRSPTVFEARANGNRVAMRFRSVDGGQLNEGLHKA